MQSGFYYFYYSPPQLMPQKYKLDIDNYVIGLNECRCKGTK